MASVMTAILPSGFMHYTTAVSRGMSDDPQIVNRQFARNTIA
jgi:hypothetical protein